GPRSPCGCDGKTRSYLLEPMAHSVRAEKLTPLLARIRSPESEMYVAWVQNRLVPRKRLARIVQQAHDLLRRAPNRHHVRGPAGEVGRRGAPAHGAIHRRAPVTGGDAQRAHTRPNRLQKLDTELAQALDDR